MLLELDLLVAIVALLLILPVPVLQILSNQSLSSASLTQLGERLMLSAETQKLAFQLDSIGDQPANFSSLINSSEYALLPSSEATTSVTQNSSNARVVVVGGKLYYMLVRK